MFLIKAVRPREAAETEEIWRERLRQFGLQGCSGCPYAGRPAGETASNLAGFCADPQKAGIENGSPGYFYFGALAGCPLNRIPGTQ